MITTTFIYSILKPKSFEICKINNFFFNMSAKAAKGKTNIVKINYNIIGNVIYLNISYIPIDRSMSGCILGGLNKSLGKRRVS